MEMTIGSAATRLGRALGRRLLRLSVRLTRGSAPEFLTQSRAGEIDAVHTWIREYLGRPHPDLGRRGPVCPFAAGALQDDGLWVTFDDRIDGKSAWRLRRALLRYADAYASRARAARHPELTALMVILPRVPKERYARLDDLHSEMKTMLMTGDVMVSALHPESSRPAVWNPNFHVLRAPFPAFAFRTMDVRDIVFVAQNRKAFAHYAARFGHLYAEGRVSDEFGYATAFAQARERFGSA
jgi:heptaprenyl diphosphate synthase